MAYTEIAKALIRSGKALMNTLLSQVDTNFQDHETRIVALETRVSDLPPGVVFPRATATPPTGYLLCDGSTYLRATYAALFTALGGASSPWGLPSGTEFKVPDLRGRAPIGAGLGTGLTNRALAATVGTETHTLASPGEIPNHTHSLSESPHQHTWGDVANWASSGSSSRAVQLAAGQEDYATDYRDAGVTLNSTGSTGAHQNMQPTVALHFVIKT